MHDTWPNPDDNICDVAVAVPFEDGWNKNVAVHCTGSSADVVVTFHIQPM